MRPDPPPANRREHARALLVSALFLGAVLWPLTQDPLAGDDFPLSTYPMFAKARGGTGALVHLVAIDAEGIAAPLGPRWFGDRQVMQAHQTLKRAAREPKRAHRLCTEAAKRVAAAPEWADAVELQLRRDRYDITAWFAEGRAPETLRVAARCDVPR